MLSDERVLENVRLAVGCGAAPDMVMTVAAASLGAASIDEAFTGLQRLRPELERLWTETPRPHRELAPIESELRTEPPVARMRLEVSDHELRGKLLFGELLGKRSFIQVAALSIAGVELSDADAQLLDHEGVLTQLSDLRIWPLTVTRRIAANGGTLAQAVVAGLATLCTQQMTVQPVAGFMRYLDRVSRRLAEGETVEAVVAATVGQGERVSGMGRPVLEGDERVPPKLALARRYGRADGESMRLAAAIDTEVQRLKGLSVNSAGYQGALLRDLGFAPDAAAAFCMVYFAVPVLTHAVAGS